MMVFNEKFIDGSLADKEYAGEIKGYISSAVEAEKYFEADDLEAYALKKHLEKLNGG